MIIPIAPQLMTVLKGAFERKENILVLQKKEKKTELIQVIKDSYVLNRTVQFGRKPVNKTPVSFTDIQSIGRLAAATA